MECIFQLGGISIDEQIEPAMKLKQEAHNIWREPEWAFMKKRKLREMVFSAAYQGLWKR